MSGAAAEAAVEHAIILAMMLAAIDWLTAQINELTAWIEILAEPYLEQIRRLEAVHAAGDDQRPRRDRRDRADMTVFPVRPAPGVLGRWCPQVVQSGGKRKGSSASGHGNAGVSAALVNQRQRRPCPVLPWCPIPSAGHSTFAV